MGNFLCCRGKASSEEDEDQGIGENSWNRGLEEEEVRNEIQSSGGN